MFRLKVLLFFAICGIGMANAQIPQTMHDAVKAELIKRCSDQNSSSKIADCQLAIHSYYLIAGGQPSPFISEVFRDENLECRNLKYRVSNIYEYINKQLNLRLRAPTNLNCKNYMGVFEQIYEVAAIGNECPKLLKTNTERRDCLKAIFDYNRIEKMQRTLHRKIVAIGTEEIVTANNRPGFRKDIWLEPKATQNIRGFYDRVIRETMSWCKSYPNQDTLSRFMRIGQEQTTSDPIPEKEVNRITCLEAAQALAELGYPSAKVTLAAIQPSCNEPSAEPTFDQVMNASAITLAPQICSTDRLIQLGPLAKNVRLRIEGETCVHELAGLLIRKWRAVFASNKCVKTGDAWSCSGEVRHYCGAGDTSRQRIDCVNQTYTAPASAKIFFDKATCNWRTDAISIDYNRVTPFEVR